MYAQKLVLNEEKDKDSCAVNIFQLCIVRGTKELQKLLVCAYGQAKIGVTVTL